MTHFKRAVLYLAAGMLIAVAARQADGEDPLAQTARGGVIVKQADIVGQVFIASERPGRRDEPAANVTVQIRTLEDDEVVQETRTDKDGAYKLPMLAVGKYNLRIGALKLPLIVEEDPAPEGELPKVIITILPKEMLRWQN